MNTDLQEGTFQSGIAHTKAAADNSLAALTDTDSAFNEDQALAVLKNRDLPSEILEQISKNGRL
ncbi:MAG TPA: hypothetical protein VFA89_24145 [Terriglobales bacterium]|nr:hypothetical protein [Terriglobales bacterium]